MTLRFALARGLADVLGTLLHEAARATGTIRAWTGLRPLRAAPVRGILVAGLDFVPIVARIRDWPWTDAKRVPCVPHSHSREASPGRWSCSHIQSVRDDVEPLERRLRSV